MTTATIEILSSCLTLNNLQIVFQYTGMASSITLFDNFSADSISYFDSYIRTVLVMSF